MVKKKREHLILNEHDNDTRVLYKKSNNTIGSRTFSGASQLSRSGISQLRRKLSKHKDFYLEGGKVKRDLSIETDVCVLRRYCMRKRNKMSKEESSRSKSRYSNFTEFDTIDEFSNQSDTGCESGDSKLKPDSDNTIPGQLNVDLTAVMIENFKGLLTNWMQTHFTKQDKDEKKIEEMVNAMLEGRESKPEWEVSSCNTYILDKHEKGRHEEESLKSISDKSEPIYYSMPLLLKKFKMISTLSIPRDFHRCRVICRKEDTHKIKKEAKVVLSIKEPGKLFSDNSKCDFSSQSLMTQYTKHENCASTNKVKNESAEASVPSVLATPSLIKCENTKLDKGTLGPETNVIKKNATVIVMPSLLSRQKVKLATVDLQTSYASDNFTMTSAKTVVDKYVSNVQVVSRETGYSCHSATIETTERLDESNESNLPFILDYVDESIEFSNVTDTKKYSKNINRKIGPTNKITKRSKKRRKYVINKLSFPAFESIQHKDFSYLYRCVNRNAGKKNEFLRYFQDVFRYLAHYETNKNIKVDVHVNVFPMFGNTTEEAGINVESDLNSRELKESHSDSPKREPEDSLNTNIDQNVDSFKEIKNYGYGYSPEIIPLLDSTTSHAKYICTEPNSSIKHEEPVEKPIVNLTDRSTETMDLQISQEIKELKSAIRDLAVTAGLLLKEHLNNKNKDNFSKPKIEIATSFCEKNTDNLTSSMYSSFKQEKKRNDLKVQKLMKSFYSEINKSAAILKKYKNVKPKNVVNVEATQYFESQISKSPPKITKFSPTTTVDKCRTQPIEKNKTRPINVGDQISALFSEIKKIQKAQTRNSSQQSTAKPNISFKISPKIAKVRPNEKYSFTSMDSRVSPTHSEEKEIVNQHQEDTKSILINTTDFVSSLSLEVPNIASPANKEIHSTRMSKVAKNIHSQVNNHNTKTVDLLQENKKSNPMNTTDFVSSLSFDPKITSQPNKEIHLTRMSKLVKNISQVKNSNTETSEYKKSRLINVEPEIRKHKRVAKRKVNPSEPKKTTHRRLKSMNCNPTSVNSMTEKHRTKKSTSQRIENKKAATAVSKHKANKPTRRLKSSKCVQFSSGFARNQRPNSNLKLRPRSKESHTYESENRLVLENSTSYRVIDSESVLKVTDMTSASNWISENKLVDQGLTCSLPKSKSLFEVSDEKPSQKNVMMYYCSGVTKKPYGFMCLPCDYFNVTPKSSLDEKQQSKKTLRKETIEMEPFPYQHENDILCHNCSKKLEENNIRISTCPSVKYHVTNEKKNPKVEAWQCVHHANVLYNRFNNNLNNNSHYTSTAKSSNNRKCSEDDRYLKEILDFECPESSNDRQPKSCNLSDSIQKVESFKKKSNKEEWSHIPVPKTNSTQTPSNSTSLNVETSDTTALKIPESLQTKSDENNPKISSTSMQSTAEDKQPEVFSNCRRCTPAIAIVCCILVIIILGFYSYLYIISQNYFNISFLNKISATDANNSFDRDLYNIRLSDLGF